MHWNAEMEMAMRWMVGWGPGGVPQLGSQLRGRHPSLGPRTLPGGGGGGGGGCSSKGGGGDVPGKRARLRVRVDGGLEVRRERQRSRAPLGVHGGEKPEQARAGRRGIRTPRPRPGQCGSRTGAHGEGGSPRGRASSHSPARRVRATQAAPRPRLPPAWQQPTAPGFSQPCDYQVPTGANSRAPPGAASHLAGG